jgi:hypothetical protein
MPTYFCDGLREVTIVNGVARLEFHRLEPAERGQGREMRVMAEFTIALPVQGLTQVIGVLEKVRDQLVREGVLKPGAAADAGAAPFQTKSPNFS